MVFLMRLSFSRHPFTYIAETVMQLHISKNLMKKQTLPNLGGPEAVFSKCLFMGYAPFSSG